jgi:hypothetical protein
MAWLAFYVALSLDPTGQPMPTLRPAGRLITTSTLHVGVRPAAFYDDEAANDWGVGLTVQVTAAGP